MEDPREIASDDELSKLTDDERLSSEENEDEGELEMWLKFVC